MIESFHLMLRLALGYAHEVWLLMSVGLLCISNVDFVSYYAREHA